MKFLNISVIIIYIEMKVGGKRKKIIIVKFKVKFKFIIITNCLVVKVLSMFNCRFWV